MTEVLVFVRLVSGRVVAWGASGMMTCACFVGDARLN